MASTLKTPKRMGRPPKVGAKSHTIKITDAVANYYRSLGVSTSYPNGNLTVGIERGAKRRLRGGKL